MLSKVGTLWIIFLNPDSTLNIFGSFKSFPRTHHRPCDSKYGGAPCFTKIRIHREGGILVSFTSHTALTLQPDSCPPSGQCLSKSSWLSCFPISQTSFQSLTSFTTSLEPHHNFSYGHMIWEHGFLSSSLLSFKLLQLL